MSHKNQNQEPSKTNQSQLSNPEANLSEADKKELEMYRKNAIKAKEKADTQMIEDQKNGKRVYKNEARFFDHDLFKLEVASMKHDKGLDGVYIGDRCVIKPRPRYVDVEHVHFFHSFDSNGKKQEYSNSIAGHCHKVDFMPDENGQLIAKCGPSKIRNGGKVFEMKNQESIHTHAVGYVVSEKLPMRVVNKEAQRHGLK